MAKRCEEEFNPWPPFVDIFSSVILVLLLFLLITIVNIAYYAQFKFKVSYTGTIATNELIVKSSAPVPPVVKVEVKKEKMEVKVEDAIEEKEDIGEIESAGKDLSKIYVEESTKQATISKDDYLLVNFGSNMIKLDNPIILQVKEFITKMKEKYPKHRVYISAVDPTNQVSATVMKQISLGRTLNMRNLIRGLNYNIRDVRVDLLKSKDVEIQNENDFGFLVIKVEKK